MKPNSHGNEAHLRDILRKCRMQRGITQTSLAVMLAKPQSFVSKYESGERVLTFVEAVSICVALKVPPEKMLKEYLQHHDT